jgi:hypothetical protein
MKSRSRSLAAVCHRRPHPRAWSARGNTDRPRALRRHTTSRHDHLVPGGRVLRQTRPSRPAAGDLGRCQSWACRVTLAPAVVCTVIVSWLPSPGVASRGDAVQFPCVTGTPSSLPVCRVAPSASRTGQPMRFANEAISRTIGRRPGQVRAAPRINRPRPAVG